MEAVRCRINERVGDQGEVIASRLSMIYIVEHKRYYISYSWLLYLDSLIRLKLLLWLHCSAIAASQQFSVQTIFAETGLFMGPCVYLVLWVRPTRRNERAAINFRHTSGLEICTRTSIRRIRRERQTLSSTITNIRTSQEKKENG